MLAPVPRVSHLFIHIPSVWYVLDGQKWNAGTRTEVAIYRLRQMQS